MSGELRTEDEAVRFAERCPECGTASTWRPPRRRPWRALLATLASLVLVAAGLALLSKRSTSVVTSGIFIGQTVAGNWTLVDIRAVRDGSKDGAGL
ncbi:MAG: hypothetical protein KDA22_04035, partial [Phycisphaerales bacterium]|nr:hypothetical protein [Phycisphaerales bacterium]